MMTFGSLFSGIGGLDLGLERAGLACQWQVEIDGFARQILARHWPSVHRFEDVQAFARTPAAELAVDMIAGGFPCQDISVAGNREGIDGKRSGLWSEFERIVRVLRPAFVLVENVTRLLAAGFDRVLGDLARLGYVAEWLCLPASAFGATHRRYRVFIVANALGERCDSRKIQNIFPRILPETEGAGGSQRWHSRGVELVRGLGGRVRAMPPSGVCRMDDGLSDRLDRYRTLGNAVHPAQAEWVGRHIVAAWMRREAA